MAHSSFMKLLPIISKVVTSLDVNTEQFNSYLLLFKFCIISFFFFSTLSCMSDCEGNVHDIYPKYHDLLIVLVSLSVEIGLINNKSPVCKLISFLLEPFEEFEPNTVQSEILKDFNIRVTVYGKVAAAFFVLSTPFYTVAPLLLFNTKQSEYNGCIDLVFGWVQRSNSYWYTLPVYISSMIGFTMESAVILLSFLLMAYAILKIKCTIRLLCADLDDMSRMMGWSEERSEPSRSVGNSMYWEEDSMIRTVPSTNDSRENKADRPKSVEREKDSVHSGLQMYRNENILRKRMKLYVANIVERHLNIIQYVHLTDKSFRLQIMAFVQLGMITVALAVPKLSLGSELTGIDYISRGVEVLGFLAMTGVISIIGQTLIDESESLRQALYSCDWTDKPHSLRRDLLIMQTVATKPLKLTVGGIYTLGMETYGNIVSATYSYTSFIQSQN